MTGWLAPGAVPIEPPSAVPPATVQAVTGAFMPDRARPGLHPRVARAARKSPGAGEVTSADLITPGAGGDLAEHSGAGRPPPLTEPPAAPPPAPLRTLPSGPPRRPARRRHPRSPVVCWRR